MRTFPLRFFWILMRPSVSTSAIVCVLLAFGVYLEGSYADGFDQVVAIALFLQLFSASTGYRDRLRRGHFDPVLISRPGRWRVALAHWTASVALGVLVWVVLGVIDLIGRQGHWPTPFTAAGVAVMLYVSTMAWMVSLPLTRYAGAVLWLAILFALASTQHLQALRQAFSPGADTASGILHSAISALVCPIFLLLDPPATSAAILAVAWLATAFVWSVGATMVGRFDGRLTET